MSHLVNVQNNENGQVKSIAMNHLTFPLFTANNYSMEWDSIEKFN